MTPNVTFIIPVYNGASLLDEAVQSILNQTCDYGKLLLIDDASCDQSRAVMDRYTDLRITKYYSDQNRGLYPTLIEAVDKVDTEWVVILMQDDQLKPSYLEEMLALVSKYPSGQAFWATDDTIGPNGQILVRGNDTSRVEFINPGKSAWLQVLKQGSIWTISGSLTRRSLFLSDPFRTDLPHTGDYEWSLRAIRQAQFIWYERPLTNIRIHPKQASATNLAIGRDIEEHYKVMEHHFCLHAQDLPRLTAFSSCINRVRVISRRSLKALVSRNYSYAAWLVRYILKFLYLPLAYKHRKETLLGS